MFSSIRLKLLPIVIIGTIVTAAVFYSVYFQTQRHNLDKSTLADIRSAKETFYNLEQKKKKTLQAAITQFIPNKDFVSVFLENNRNKLYEYGQPLFLKNEALGITHFYFIRKDGTVLSRLHNPNKYDDKVTRKTFEVSRTTNGWGSGIELGKTAFACSLIAALQAEDWTAVKITLFGHGICSADGKPCECAVNDPDHPFALTAERDTSGAADTSRMLRAGAREAP